MRLYAFLLVTVAAAHARAATIPEPATEKKLVDIVPGDLEKTPENSASEPELIDNVNTIKDVENKLRTKPAVIPVEVVVEEAQAAPKTGNEKDDSEEINRPTPDLRNPGPPQRQEHETQNPEYYAFEQETVLNFKKSVNDAQILLQNGFQRVADGIHNMLENNEQMQTVQQSIKSLRDGFTAQINKINGTVQNFLNSEVPVVQQTKANFQQLEYGLNALKQNFNTGVKSLADGVEVVASLKADTEKPVEGNPPTPTAAPETSSQGPQNQFAQYIESLQTSFGHTLQNITQFFNNFTQTSQWTVPNPFAQASSTALPAGVQSDTQVNSSPATSAPNVFQNIQNQFNQGITGLFPTPAAGQFGSGSGYFAQVFQSFQENIANLLQFKPPAALPTPSAQPPPAEHPPSTVQPAEPKPDANSPAPVGETTKAPETTPAGPIRQILLNTPIGQGIANAVQKLQNSNNPEKPREVERIEEQKSEEVEKVNEVKPKSDSINRGHNRPGSANTGVSNDNSDVSSNRIEEGAAMTEEVKLPEVQKPSEDIKEHKTEEVVDKTE